MDIKHLKNISILVFAILYLFNYFLQSSTVLLITGLLLLVINIFLLPGMPKATRRVSAALYLSGGVLLVIYGKTPLYWLEAVLTNAGLATLFIFLPLISLPFFYENYQEELKNLAQHYMASIFPFCLLTFFATHLLGVIILLGAPSIIYQILGPNARYYNAERPFLASLMQGMMASGFWSPVWTSILVISHYLDISWLQIVPYGLFFAFLSLCLTIAWLYLEMRRHPDSYQVPQPDPTATVNWKYIYTIIILAFSFILAIISLDLLTTWKIVTIIPVVAWTLPLLIALFQRKTGKYLAGMRNYYHKGLSSVRNEVVLFTSAGFLGKSLEAAGIGSLLPHILPPWLNSYPLVSILLIMAVMVLLSLVGLHPIISGTALASAINPLTLGLPVFIFALTLLCGWAICILVSPFSGNNLVLSGIASRPPWSISLGINGCYGMATLVLMALVINGIMYL